MLTRSLTKSRFNPVPGVLDFWHEFRKPNPMRWPILIVSTAPFALIFLWLSGETVYVTPEQPQITYITSFAPDRTDEEIIASNIENQEVRELREEYEAELAQRKRDMYKALGAAAGMDVEEIERRADANRAAEEAEQQRRLDEAFGRTEGSGSSGETSDQPSQPSSESPTP